MDEPKAQSITIQIVGALRGQPFIGDRLEALLRRVETALFETFPEFLPANPAVTIQTAELRDDWLRRQEVPGNE
jgi:hypothetical protein